MTQHLHLRLHQHLHHHPHQHQVNIPQNGCSDNRLGDLFFQTDIRPNRGRGVRAPRPNKERDGKTAAANLLLTGLSRWDVACHLRIHPKQVCAWFPKKTR